MIMRERLHVTEDRQVAVRDGDKRAAFLLVAKGQEVPKVIAEKYGIVDGRLKQKKKAADKMTEKPPDKMASKPNNKFVKSEGKEKNNG